MATEEATIMMTEEAIGLPRYVYVQTIGHLWRFDREGEDSNYDDSVVRHGPGDVKKGVLTKLIDFLREGLPLAAGGFALDSKLYFVGGETVKPRSTPPPPPPPVDDDDSDVDSDDDVDEKAYINEYCDISLNKQVFVFDKFSDSHSEPSFIRSGFESKSLAPKSCPFVFPVKNGDKTLIYVLSTEPVFCTRTALFRTMFEVYDPVLNLWTALEPPPFPGTLDVAFQLDSKIFIWIRRREFVFNLDTNKWERTHFFDAWLSDLGDMHPVGDGILLSCWSFMLRAFKICSKPEHGTRGCLVRHQRLQGLSEMCAPYWSVYPGTIPSSTLCNLGDGYMLFISTSLCPARKNLHFYFVTFRVHKYSPDGKNGKKHVLKPKYIYAPLNFVEVEPVAYCHRVVPCEDSSWMSWKVCQAYVL